MEKVMDLITEESARQITEAREFLENEVSTITIETEDQYAGAALLIKELKSRKKKLDETRASEKEPYLTKGRDVDATFKPVIVLIDEKIQIVERAGRTYRDKMEQIRIAEQKRLQDEAEVRRAKLESQANTASEKAAALRQMAQDYRTQAGQCKDIEETNRLLAEAMRCENRAYKYDEKVEAKVEQAASYVAPVIAPVIPKNTRGAFNTRVYYGARLTNMDTFLQHVQKNRQYQLIIPNQSMLDQLATMSKGQPSTVPGVEFYKKG